MENGLGKVWNVLDCQYQDLSWLCLMVSAKMPQLKLPHRTGMAFWWYTSVRKDSVESLIICQSGSVSHFRTGLYWFEVPSVDPEIWLYVEYV